MANTEGQRLTTEQVERLEAYKERGVTPPEEFNDVVFENVAGGNVGGGYRYKTAAEKAAEEGPAKEEAERAERRAKNLAEVDKQGVGANVVAGGRVPVGDVGTGTTTAGAGVSDRGSNKTP